MIIHTVEIKKKSYVREDSVIEILEEFNIDKESIEQVKDAIRRTVS